MGEGFSTLFTNSLLAGFIVFSILAFGSFLQAENDVSTEDQFTNNTLIGSTFGKLQTNLNGLRDESQSQKQLFEKENPTGGFGSILLFSIVSSGRIFGSSIVEILNIITILPVVILGIDPIVVGVIMTLIAVSLIFGLWAVYKLGG